MTVTELEAAILTLPGVSKRYAFNGDGYYVRARLFAFLEPGGIVLRIPEPQRSQALDRDGALAFTMPRTSVRHDWIFVPLLPSNEPPEPATDADLLLWAALARDHVAAMNG